jgi:hypothetical protein
VLSKVYTISLNKVTGTDKNLTSKALFKGDQTMKKNKLLLAIAIIFLIVMILFTYDMASRTVKPWDKKKNNVLKKYDPQR